MHWRKSIKDGGHHMSRVRALSSVLVTPLQPPFPRGTRTLSFDGGTKDLAVSEGDAARIDALLGGQTKGRRVVLEAEGDLIRVSLSH